MNASGLLTPDQVAELALSNGWSVVELCRRADIAHSTFRRWQLGQNRVTLATYEKILNVATQQKATDEVAHATHARAPPHERVPP